MTNNRANITSFKLRNIPWNKGTKGLLKINSGSFKKGEHRSPNTEFKKGQISPNKGKKASLKTRELQRQAKLKNPVKPMYWKGKKFTNEHKRKIGNKHKGENHWNWKGGISGKGYPENWNNSLKRFVFIRDNFKCFLCQINKKIVVHHINKDKKDCDENNLITLCRSCHVKLHKNLDKKIILVTGNSKGIGKSISEKLRLKGYYVPNISRKTNFNLIEENGINRLIYIINNFPIFGIINNVGGCGTCSYPEWRIAMEKNYGITTLLTQAFLSKKRKWGRVITISSIYGKEKGPNPWFTAAKAAQIALMKSLAGKYEGITFNTICPGHIDVGKSGFISSHIGKPKDVANLVAFLCSDKANHINGATITVDGGESHSF